MLHIRISPNRFTLKTASLRDLNKVTKLVTPELVPGEYIDPSTPIHPFVAAILIDLWLDDAVRAASKVMGYGTKVIIDLGNYGNVHPTFIDIFFTMLEVESKKHEVFSIDEYSVHWVGIEGEEHTLDF